MKIDSVNLSTEFGSCIHLKEISASDARYFLEVLMHDDKDRLNILRSSLGIIVEANSEAERRKP